jgi:uncharacterized protein YndB with AHSA1/START domain
MSAVSFPLKWDVPAPSNRRTLMIVDTIEQDIVVAAPVERVWAVLTESDHMSRWFGPASVDLQPGGVILFQHLGHGLIPAVIEQLEPARTLAFRWAVIGPPGERPRPGNCTEVEFTLVPEGSSTRLHLRESGFSEVQATPEELQVRYNANKAGWPRILSRLGAHITAVH